MGIADNIVRKAMEDGGFRPGEFVDALTETNKQLKKLNRNIDTLNKNIKKLVK